MISIKGLNKFFNKGRQNENHVLNDINLELPEKGMVAIFGKSGCGKTTLLNVIGGLDGFAGGTITIEGQSIAENTDVLRNKYIGYIFQNYNLNKADTCFDNVADALRLCGVSDDDEIEERVTAALINVGMEKYSNRTPDTLSGGQQQRIAIARAIVKNPRIILADEPTGNLDEANTVMIMDLLRAISKDHLVLLVTHEANLVDYYCDTVIELSDGKVVGIRNNLSANGFLARDKNAIYLGELRRTELSDSNAQIEFYGDEPNTPVRLKIINNAGKLYVEILTDKVNIIDEFSEVKLREGVFEEKGHKNELSDKIDMSKLPPVNGTCFGKLFSVRSSVKSGYISNFKNLHKGKKLLRSCMCLFAAVIVFMSAVFGTVIGDIINAKNAYNHNVFYIYTPNAEISQKLNSAVLDPASGIDLVRLTGRIPSGDQTIYFRTGSFETFEEDIYGSNFKTNAVFLDVSLAKDLELVEGKKDDMALEEILISTRVADALLERSTLGYISERKDLIGLVSDMYNIDGKSPRIVGIVESEEPAVYLTELALAKYVRGGFAPSLTSLASDFGLELSAGEAILAIKNENPEIKYPSVGETVKIQGIDVRIVAIKRAFYDYSRWLEHNNVEKLDEAEYFTDIVKREHPNLNEDSDEFIKILSNLIDTRYYEYFDYYYSEVDAFLKDIYLLDPNNFEIWMYFDKEVAEAKYLYLPEEYYIASVFKEKYERYPTDKELAEVYKTIQPLDEVIKSYRILYEEDFWSKNRPSSMGTVAYMLSDEDYIATSKQIGETHGSALQDASSYGYDIEIKEYAYSYSASNDVVFEMNYKNLGYSVIHSCDPEKTEEWIHTALADLPAPTGYLKAIVAPNDVFNDIIKNNIADIIKSAITMGIVLVLMSICMYFIMRSSLMNRIKEVGIYRAIGVSKKNLVFKFFIEAVVLASLTVFLGYLLTSAFIFVCLGMSSLMSKVFYYPLWLSLLVLALIYLISLFFGTLPIRMLLRKTPSEILAKYDI